MHLLFIAGTGGFCPSFGCFGIAVSSFLTDLLQGSSHLYFQTLSPIPGFLQEVLCPSQPVSEPVLSPSAPLSSVLSLLAVGQGSQPKLLKGILSPSSLTPASDPPPSHPQSLHHCARSVFSRPPFLSFSSANSLLNELLCLTPVPLTSHWLSVPPISFTGFWVRHLLPVVSSPPFSWPLPWAPSPSSPFSSSVWPSQMYVVSAGTLSSAISFLPTSLVWLPPPH